LDIFDSSIHSPLSSQLQKTNPINNITDIYLTITKSTHPPTNKKPRLESIKLQSGYETHAVSSILNWLEDE